VLKRSYTKRGTGTREKVRSKKKKKIIYHDQVGLITGMQGWLTLCKSISLVQCIKKSEEKNHLIISTEAEKAFDNIQDHFMIKALKKLGTERTYLNTIKVYMINIWPTLY
jgi:hypothetical protein